MFARGAGSLRLLFVLLAATLTVAADVPVRADEPTDDYNFAVGLFKKEKWLLAEEAFEKFVGKYPKHQRVPLARYYLGLSQFESEKYAPARKTLRTFITDFPQSPDISHARFRAAECSYFLDEFEAAVTEFAEFDKSIQSNAQDPDYEEALAFQGDAQRRLKRYPDAIASFEKQLKLYANGRLADEARFGLAHSLDASGQTDKAIELFRQLAATPTATRADAAQIGLANLLFAKEKYDEAAEAYLKLEKDFSKSRYVPTAQLNAGYALYRRGQFANAQAAFDRAEDTPAQAVTAGYWKGLSAKALGDFSGASTILEGVLKLAGKDPIAEQITFQLADSELRAGRFAEAEKWFSEVASHWPQGQNAAQSLYFATECVLEQIVKLQGEERVTKLKQVELLLDKFAREHGQSAFAMSHKLQRGQFLILRGSDADLQAAEDVFKAVAAESQKPQTQRDARLRLSRLRQSRGNRTGAIEALRPLVDEILKAPDIGYADTLVAYAGLSLEVGQFDEAIRVADAYLKQNAKGGLSDQALSTTSLAYAQSKNWDKTAEAFDRLTKEHTASPSITKTTQALAEVAYGQQNWDRAIHYFGLLSRVDAASPLHATALSGLGWSHFQKMDYVGAETQFRQFVKDHPKHELTAESAFMIGDSLQKANKLPDAQKAFAEALRGYQPSRHAFLSGLQAARIAVKLADTTAADKAYAEVDAAFPMAKERDQLLNEWALVLYDAEKFERSDEMFRELIKAFPESPLADNAQFSLAESELVSGKLENAAKNFRALASNAKADAVVQEDSLYRLIAIYSDQKKWKDVVATQKELRGKFAESRYGGETLLQASNAQLNLEDFAGAEQSLLEVTKQASNPLVVKSEWFPHVWVLLAESQLRQTKYAEVIKTAERARQVQGDFEIQYRLDEIVGRAYKQQPLPKFDEARQAFQRVLASPKGARTETACKAQLMIAETYFIQKNYKDAADAYRRVYILYEFPEWQSAALYQAAICEEELRMTPQAIDTLKAFIKEFPQSGFIPDAKKRLERLMKS